MPEQIEGKNPIMEALRAGHEITKIFVLKGEPGGPANDILKMAHQKGIPVSQVDIQVLNRMTVTRNHQGIIALAAAWDYASIDEIMKNSAGKGEPPFLLILDGIEDPQNFGSIIRTAEAVGVHGIIIQERRAVGLTAAVARASAGAIEHIPVARVTNINKTIEMLKEQGIWFTGADTDGELEFQKANLHGPLGLVVGSEGKGISRLVKENCDQTVRLPLWGKLNSLNVSVATGVLVYEVRRQRSLG
jgi:23S rRNA (guanosine2251-2'-O)-methyltransferase